MFTLNASNFIHRPGRATFRVYIQTHDISWNKEIIPEHWDRQSIPESHYENCLLILLTCDTYLQSSLNYTSFFNFRKTRRATTCMGVGRLLTCLHVIGTRTHISPSVSPPFSIMRARRRSMACLLCFFFRALSRRGAIFWTHII